MEKVTFKSFPEYYEKEKSGIKNNTVRQWFLEDKRFKKLDDYLNGIIKDLYIEIINTETKDSFIRKIKDVSVLDWTHENYIITWEE